MKSVARLFVLVLVLVSATAVAEPRKSEAEFLVPPQGGAFQVPVHSGEVCILSFPEKMASKALASSPDFEIKSWGDDGVAVRAVGQGAKTTTLALATTSGAIKVNVTLVVVAAKDDALTLVRFKQASSDEAFRAAVDAAVKKELEPIRAELAHAKQGVDQQIRDRADGLIAERLLRRNEAIVLNSHERNDDHVIVHVTRAALLGDDGYLMFEIENRSSSAYRLARVEVQVTGRNLAGPARLASTAVDRDPSVIGVVPAGASARGVVVVRAADQALGKPLRLILAGPGDAGVITLDRGIVLR